MFNQNSIRLILVSTLLFFGLTVKAGVEPFHGTTLQTTFSPLTPVTALMSSTVTVNPMTAAYFNDVSVTDILTLAVNHDAPPFVTTAGTVEVTLKLEKWDKDNNPLITEYPVLILQYQPFTSVVPYVDKSVYKFNDVYKYTATIQTMKVNGVTVTNLPYNLFIATDIIVERYREFSTASSSIAITSAIAADIDCDGTNDELEIVWPNIPGVEEYQLEWMFVNDYPALKTDPYLTPSVLNFNFRQNGTRITTTGLSYRISLNFDHGYIVYRLRGVGRDFSDHTVPLVGVWNSPESGLLSDANVKKIATIAHE